MPPIQGVHHVALSVSDLASATMWYERVLGATKLTDMDLSEGHHISLLVAGPLLLGLHHDDAYPEGDRFSEFRVGLDHLSFAATNRAEVAAWAERLDAHGVPHAEIADAPYGHVLVFRDPDNIQLEFMAPPGTADEPVPDDAPVVRGVSHTGITICDLEASADWYRQVFGTAQSVASMREDEFGIEYLLTEDGTTLGLTWSKATPDGDRFDELRCGLDHVGFGCDDRGTVEAWERHLDSLGVSHSGIQDVPYGHVLVFRDPDNVQLELIANPS